MTEVLLARLDDLGAPVSPGDPITTIDQSDYVYVVVDGEFQRIAVSDFIRAARETVFAITDAATVDIDPADGGIQTWALGGSRTATATSFASGQSVTLMITAGANTITWPTMVWVGTDAPDLAGTGQTVVELWKVGSVLYGALVGDVPVPS